jgi:hypothetical protein
MMTRSREITRLGWSLLAVVLHLVLLRPGSAAGLNFSSGSDGSDGALNLTSTDAPIIFNPADSNPPLDPDGDGVYHFTTITVAQGVTVKFRADVLGSKPVVWLATGAVQIDGMLDLSGEDGHPYFGPRRKSVAGAGGYGGGRGGTDLQAAEPGDGPGGGGADPNSNGDGGGHFSKGGNCGRGGGASYGTEFLLPLVGGSGGGGAARSGAYAFEPGGGAGGGALLIASSQSIAVTGSILARGGSGLCFQVCGGGGSGGAIRLAAPTISGSGGLSAGGGGASCPGSPGRIRLEAFPSSYQFSGSYSPTAFIASPVQVFPGPNTPTLRVTAVGAVPVPDNPTGSFVMPDVTIDQTTAVTLMIEAHHIPLGTVVKLRITAENGSLPDVDSSPLAGGLETSTATASATLPPGFSRFFVSASWTP